MPFTHIDPLHPENAAVAALELALRDAYARAVATTTQPLALAMRLYRSVITLARSLRVARDDAGLPAAWGENLTASVESVVVAAAGQLRDPTVLVELAIRLHRAIAALARVVHRARAGGPGWRKGPVHREAPADLPARADAEDLMHREELGKMAGGATGAPSDGPRVVLGGGVGPAFTLRRGS